MTRETEELRSQLLQLQRENRRAKRLAVTAMGLALCWPLLSWTQDDAKRGVVETVQTRKLVIVDASNRARAELGVKDEQPTLTMMDQEGKSRARLAVFKGGDAGLLVFDKDGKKRVGVLVDAVGLSHVVLNDKTERPRAHLATGPKGAPGLVFTDGKGRRLVGQGINPDNEAWRLPVPGSPKDDADKRK